MSESDESQWKIFDHLLDAIFIVDRAGRLQYTNEAFRHLCDSPKKAVVNHDEANKYIELPNECWEILHQPDGEFRSETAGYREVGFITKSGTMGRAQVFADRVEIPSLSAEPLFYLILRDVTVEARLHAKYKVQIESTERLVDELKRSLAETGFLRGLATDLPIYEDTTSLLHTIATRMRSELGFRDAHFFYLPDQNSNEVEPVGFDKRMGSRLREVVRNLGPMLKNRDEKQMVTSVVFRPFGLFWVAHFRPRLERQVVLVASYKEGGDNTDHRALLEALSGQVSTLLDNRSLYFASITDGLTGLFNRRFFDSRFGIECMRATEKRAPLTLLLVDVDNFKKVNDEHGHQAGDAVLSMLGQAIKKRIRTTDFAARVGGEEFALLLPDTTPSDALFVADSLRKQVEDLPVIVPGLASEIRVTISCGISGFRWTHDNQQTVFKMADDALYQAKQEGRNRTVIAQPSLD